MPEEPQKGGEVDIEMLKQLILERKGTTADFPFGPDVMVFRVMGKMFALCAWTKNPMEINLKCDPDHAEVLRNVYDAVRPGYHMNKRHWNTVTLDGSIPDKEFWQWVDDSYTLVAATLKKAQRLELAKLSKP